MSDAIDRAVQVIGGHVSTTMLATDIAQELDAAGRLVTPEHDRQVAAQALREWLATWPNRYVGSPIYEDGMAYAEKIERGGAR